jgi:hypothetical protein
LKKHGKYVRHFAAAIDFLFQRLKPACQLFGAQKMFWEPNLSTQKITFCPKGLMPKTCAKLSNRMPTDKKNYGQNDNRQLLRRARPKAEKGPAVLKTAWPRTNLQLK